MAHVDNINIHNAEDCVARAEAREGTHWLTLEFSEDDGKRVRRFRVSAFMDYARASRLAAAINEAWPEPAADPVIDWPRPSCDRKDTGLRYGEGMRWEDVGLPKATLAALNGDDTPDEAA